MVHLVTVDNLQDLVRPKANWIDLFRGAVAGPRVGTPTSLAWHGESLYICDTHANNVQVWNLANGTAKRLGTDGMLKKPVAVAVDDSGTVFVADTVRGEVVAFDASGTEERRFRRDADRTYRPLAVAVRGRRLYVADLANHRIDVYSTATGELRASFGRPGSGPGQFYYPSGLAIGPNGEIHVADMMNGRVQVLTPEGDFLRSIGAGEDNHIPPGKPKSIAVTPDREVLVTYAEFGSVRVFDSLGRLKLRIGQPPGELRGNPLPGGMAIATVLPVTLRALIPKEFSPRYYVWMSNIIAWNTVSLFAVGSQES